MALATCSNPEAKGDTPPFDDIPSEFLNNPLGGMIWHHHWLIVNRGGRKFGNIIIIHPKQILGVDFGSWGFLTIITDFLPRDTVQTNIRVPLNSLDKYTKKFGEERKVHIKALENEAAAEERARLHTIISERKNRFHEATVAFLEKHPDGLPRGAA